MEARSPNFVYRILAFHALLLAIVLILVAVASGALYHWTRADALRQAQVRQELLAHQTSVGIETFYRFLISDLGWIQRRQEPPNSSPATRAANPSLSRRMGAFRDRSDARLIGEELGGRVSALFVFNKLSGAVLPILPQQSKLTDADLSGDISDWLRGVTETTVSRLMEFNGRGASLVAAPFGTTDPLLLVAVVPGQEIESTFLRLLTDQNSAGVSLVDSSLRVVTSTNRNLSGVNLSQFDNPDLLDMIHAFQTRPRMATRLFTTPLRIGGLDLGPRMVTLAPVSMGQEHWMLFMAQPLGNIDASIDPLLRRAIYWAAFVAASITAVLVSTAFQMIRWRTRLDRERHQVLEREMQQARRIQQQWLPDIASAPAGMDVAAINQPANHISGDFYNWFELPDGRHAVVIGDVTGHGMAAAFLMATTQLLVRHALTSAPDTGTAMEEVNRLLSSQVFRGQFVTMLLLTIDLGRRQIEVTSAGHPAALIITNGQCRPLEVDAQLVLGIEQVHYPTQRFALPESSSLLLHTDGVIDAEGPGDQRFGLKRLAAALAAPALSAREMIDAVTTSVKVFRDSIELEDDLTMVAIQWPNVSAAPIKPAATLSQMRRPDPSLQAGS